VAAPPLDDLVHCQLSKRPLASSVAAEREPGDFAPAWHLEGHRLEAPGSGRGKPPVLVLEREAISEGEPVQ
jgi:hypothetical protein